MHQGAYLPEFDAIPRRRGGRHMTSGDQLSWGMQHADRAFRRLASAFHRCGAEYRGYDAYPDQRCDLERGHDGWHHFHTMFWEP